MSENRDEGVELAAAEACEPVADGTEVVVWATGRLGGLGRELATGRSVSLCTRQPWLLVPGEIAVVHRGRRRGDGVIDADVMSTRFDIEALGLPPLALHVRKSRDRAVPAPGAGARGPIQECEMEDARVDLQVGDGLEFALSRLDAGDLSDGEHLLMSLIAIEPRFVDAHATLGWLVLRRPGLASATEALRHFEVGAGIARQALPMGFAGVLPSNLPGNRPFLRCLWGRATCLRLLGCHAAAAEALVELHALDPDAVEGTAVTVAASGAWPSAALGDAEELRLLIEDLIESGPCPPHFLLRTIVRHGDAAVSALIAVLDDDWLAAPGAPGEGWAPVHAVDLLATIATPAAMEPLVKLLARVGAEDARHERIMLRLPWMGELALEPLLTAYASRTDPEWRASVAQALADLGVSDERIFAVLCHRLKTRRSIGVAASDLGSYGDERALPLLQDVLEDLLASDRDDRVNTDIEWVCQAIEALGGHDYLDKLYADPDPDEGAR